MGAGKSFAILKFLDQIGAFAGPVLLFAVLCQEVFYQAVRHEWWNGNGYPYGIKCERIPLIARITSVCDVYDAITGDRSYRRARSHEYACSEIEANAGTQFDPVLAKLFLDNEFQFLVN